MMFYFLILALGLMFIYSLRDALLILQNRRDKKAVSDEIARRPQCDEYIILQNGGDCKRAS